MRFIEIGVVLVIGSAFALSSFLWFGPAQGWCGVGMKDILTSCVSISGTFLAALLAMVLYVSQSSQNPSLVNVTNNGRMLDLLIYLGFGAMLWGVFLIASLALQTYQFPADIYRISLRYWHAIWSGSVSSALALSGYLFGFLLHATLTDSKNSKQNTKK